MRALPAGLLLLLMARTLPRGIWLFRAFVLGGLNFSIFWWLVFVAAEQMPGGVASTVGAVKLLIVLQLSRVLLKQVVHPLAVFAGIGGISGLALLVLNPGAAMDWQGVVAALGGAISVSFGTVLTRKWQPPVSTLIFTSWQLTAGGLLLLPAALIFEPTLPPLDTSAVLGYVYLALICGAATNFLWIRGIGRLGPAAVAPLGLLSPVAALLLGLYFLNETLSLMQSTGIMVVLLSVCVAQRVQRGAARAVPADHTTPATRVKTMTRPLRLPVVATQPA